MFWEVTGAIWVRPWWGFPNGVSGVSWGVSLGFPTVSGGFRDDMTDRFSKIEGVSSGPAKF